MAFTPISYVSQKLLNLVSFSFNNGQKITFQRGSLLLITMDISCIVWPSFPYLWCGIYHLMETGSRLKVNHTAHASNLRIHSMTITDLGSGKLKLCAKAIFARPRAWQMKGHPGRLHLKTIRRSDCDMCVPRSLLLISYFCLFFLPEATILISLIAGIK